MQFYLAIDNYQFEKLDSVYIIIILSILYTGQVQDLCG